MAIVIILYHTSNSIVESLLGEVASKVGSVQNLVVKDREVEGQSKTDGVSRGQVGLGNVGGVLVGLEGLVGRLLAAVSHGELSEVTVVVTLPDKGSVLHKQPQWSRAYILW